MSVRWFYRNNDGVITEMTTRVNDPLDVTDRAEEGEAGACQVLVHDPDGSFLIRAHRKVYVTDTEDTTQSIWAGYTADKKITRGSPFVGLARDWSIDLVDANTLIGRRIMTGADAKRPAETDVERIQWLMTTNEAALFDGTTMGHVSTDDPKNMDAADYRGQTLKQVVDDCSQQSGKNYWIASFDTGDPNLSDTTNFEFWYGDDALETYESDVRVYSGVRVNYAGSFVYVQRQATVDDFARRDVSSPAPNVKTKSTATTRGRRYLNSISQEEDTITCSVTVRTPSRVNMIRSGMRLQVRFEHLPGYETDYVWTRVVQRNVKQVGPQTYELGLTLSAPAPASAALPVYGILRRSQVNGDQTLVYWDFPGDSPSAGYPTQPTTGLLEVLTDGDPPYPPHPHPGFKVTGTGTIDVTFFATVAGVGEAITCDFNITLNGVVVATFTASHPGGFVGMDGKVTITDLEVEPDDVIAATIVPSYIPYFWVSPRGTGQSDERLEITGGSLS